MEYWYLIAILTSLVTGFYIYINQWARLDGRVAMVYRGLFLGVCLLPFMVFFAAPTNPYFYLFSILQGYCVYAVDSRIFRMSKAFGAEVTSLFQPFAIVAIFFVWIVINPNKFEEVFKNYYVFGVELVCLFLISYAFVKIKNAQPSKKVIPYLIQLVIFLVFVDTLNKKSMQASGADLFAGLYYYNLITALIIGLFAVINCKKEKIKFNFFEKRNLGFGFLILIVAGLVTAIKAASMYYTPNPAFVTAIIGFSPLWVAGINYGLYKTGKNIPVQYMPLKYLLLLVVSVSILIYAANV